MSENNEEKDQNQSNEEVSVELLNSLKEKLEAQTTEIEEKDNRLKRMMAEFDNYKKRSAKE